MHIFPDWVNEDQFDRDIADMVTRDPNKMSGLETLVKIRFGIDQDSLNTALTPESIHKNELLSDVVNSGNSFLHNEAMEERDVALHDINNDRKLELQSTNAIASSKEGQERVQAQQVRLESKTADMERSGITTQQRQQSAMNQKHHEEKTSSVADMTRNTHGETITRESANSTSSEYNLWKPNISVGYHGSRKEGQTRTSHSELEKSRQIRNADSFENGITNLAEQLKSTEQNKTTDSTQTISVTARAINPHVAAPELAQLDVINAKYDNLARNTERLYGQKIRVANLVYLLKISMLTGRVHPKEIIPMLSTVQRFPHLESKADELAQFDGPEEAIRSYETALAERRNFLTTELKFDENRADNDFVSARIHGKLGDRYLELEQPEKAEFHYLTSAEVYGRLFKRHEPVAASNAYFNLADFYSKTGRLQDAKRTFEEARDLAGGSNEERLKATAALIKVQKQLEHSAETLALMAAPKGIQREELVLSEAIALLSHEDPAIRAMTLRIIAEQNKSELVEHVVPLINDKDASTREAAIETMAKIGRPEDSNFLASLLNHADVNEKDNALGSVIKLGEKSIDVVKPLVASQDQNVQHSIIEILGQYGKPEDAELVKPLIRHRNEETVIHATSAYIKLVKPLLDHNDPTVRHSAIDDLCLTLGDRARDVLKPEQSREINTAILAELESLSNNFPFTVQQDDDVVRQSASAIDISKTVDSFMVESLSKGLDDLFKFINFKERHKVSNSRFSASVHSHFNQALEDGYHEAVATLYRVWANYHNQAGEHETAAQLESKAHFILKEVAKLAKK